VGLTPMTVILDACVLYSSTLRNLLMYLATTDLLWARWTHRIHEEWMENVQRRYPDMTRDKVERIRDLMDTHAPDPIVTGYEDLVAGLSLPDPDDRHVLAAAIRAAADAIVTFDLAHFPAEILGKSDVEALHPDDFLERLIDLNLGIVCAAVRRHRASLKKPPKSVDEYLADLEKTGIPRTAAILRQYRGLV
jgi:predicted nucleic acid-binding protein